MHEGPQSLWFWNLQISLENRWRFYHYVLILFFGPFSPTNSKGYRASSSSTSLLQVGWDERNWIGCPCRKEPWKLGSFFWKVFDLSKNWVALSSGFLAWLTNSLARDFCLLERFFACACGFCLVFLQSQRHHYFASCIFERQLIFLVPFDSYCTEFCYCLWLEEKKKYWWKHDIPMIYQLMSNAPKLIWYRKLDPLIWLHLSISLYVLSCNLLLFIISRLYAFIDWSILNTVVCLHLIMYCVLVYWSFKL